MILLIDACARTNSRTLALAKGAVRESTDAVETVDLFAENPPPLNAKTLAERERFVQASDFSAPMFRFAKQFREADEIIIAAPYWDLSYPAILKCYLEAVCVSGLTFFYNEKGIPQGLCKAKRLTYITTAGGRIPENNYGYNYVKELCNSFFGIKDTACIKAEGLDIVGADTVKTLADAKSEIERRFCR